MKNHTTKANKKQIKRSTKQIVTQKKQKSRKTAKTTNQQRTTPRIIEKWSPKLKNGGQIEKRLTMEPRGGKNRIRARKMTQDSARQLPRAAMVAQTRLWWKAGVPKWRPKWTKIDEQIY